MSRLAAPAAAERTAMAFPFTENTAAMPPGSLSRTLYVSASTTVVTSSERSSARWWFESRTTALGATGTARVVSSFLLVPLKTVTSVVALDAGDAGEGVPTDVRTILPLAESTWIEVGVPLTSRAVVPTTVFVLPSISVRVFWVASRTRIRFSASFSASALGRPPTTIVVMSSCVFASSAPTVPLSGCATYSVFVRGLRTTCGNAALAACALFAERADRGVHAARRQRFRDGDDRGIHSLPNLDAAAAGITSRQVRVGDGEIGGGGFAIVT